MATEKLPAANVPPMREAKRGRPLREATVQIGAQILDVALDHFFRHGFEGANMDAIAADVGVTRRTLYQRFESKQGLLKAVWERESLNYLRLGEVALPRGDTRKQLTVTAMTMLDATLSPRVVAFIGLRHQLERQGLPLDTSPQEKVVAVWKAAFGRILTGDPGLANADADRIEHLAHMIFDLLVTVPRARVTLSRELADTKAAKLAYMEDALDFIAGGVPFLGRSRSLSDTIQLDDGTPELSGRD